MDGNAEWEPGLLRIIAVMVNKCSGSLVCPALRRTALPLANGHHHPVVLAPIDQPIKSSWCTWKNSSEVNDMANKIFL